ncbi:VIT1/CCC1 transporter family protein [Catellatospora sp. KI3]|uniref:VIT1/CCC1 transporter family protein n=1 Tax=Catellatospora sp. KI3 TaxID=3041620 RepID=UPI0024824804|nr:VIT1/CCC1 transporter family protein [Catellatospora sp. KI3]MDI1459434.1 VIT1/CCC1 transporter family protein [Catellatospora sp. KI3]
MSADHPSSATQAQELPPIDHEHADVSGGWLRAAVFGAMDGLVTNIGLIAGVGGAGVAAGTIALTGVAGLVAGAISMGLGEYASVRTANEQIEAEIAKERRELRRNPLAEADELAQRWIDRGIAPDLARQLAHELSEQPDEALRMHVREELGIDPDSKPSPWTAAISSFVCFSIGALIPLLSYLLGSDSLWLALSVGGLGLFVVGALTARFTRRRWWATGLRQLLLGAAAAGATYLIGAAIGVSTT